MGYPGGKAGSGVCHRIINLMPPHQVYIEPFLGDGAVMRAKRAARLNIGLDLDPKSPGLAWLATLAEKNGARSPDPIAKSGAAAGIVRSRVAGSGESRRYPSSPTTSGSGIAANGGGVLRDRVTPGMAGQACNAWNGGAGLGTASPSPARGPGASARLARVDRGKLLTSPDLASSAERAGNDEPGSAYPSPLAGNGKQSLHGGNGEAADYRFGCLDGIELLRVYPFTGTELVYCDPPYLMSTRSGRRLYAHEMTDVDHRRFLRVIQGLPCMVMVSGYWSRLYADAFTSWNSIHFEAMTRAGHTATEWVWFNFPEPTVLHDDRYLGEGFRKREQLKRKKLRWLTRLRAMPMLDRQALLSAIASIDTSGE